MPAFGLHPDRFHGLEHIVSVGGTAKSGLFLSSRIASSFFQWAAWLRGFPLMESSLHRA